MYLYCGNLSSQLGIQCSWKGLQWREVHLAAMRARPK
uniref:Uncharacterized protein n=1 Tax=Arundo donax TaxID=35708 RepID=A0A0A9I0Y3_ARUDO